LIKKFATTHGVFTDRFQNPIREQRLYWTLGPKSQYPIKLRFSPEGIWIEDQENEENKGLWTPERIEKIIRTKIKSVLKIEADVDIRNGVEWFRFHSPILMTGLTPETFIDAAARNVIKIDLRAHINEKGKCRDHGTAFRVMEKDYGQLYPSIINL